MLCLVGRGKIRRAGSPHGDSSQDSLLGVKLSANNHAQSDMNSPTASPQPLAVPHAEPAHFARNFIRQAVCELRFPTLFELEAGRPPTSFSQALRKEYPLYEVGNDLNVSVGGVAQAHVHFFKSKRARWTVTLRASAISVETSNYDAFDELEARLDFIVKAAEKIIDSEFFTRVGLRYVNSVPYNLTEIHEWVNPAIVGALGTGLYGDVVEHSQRVSGPTTSGGYLFQHGLGVNPQNGQREYILDFDFFREDVAVTETTDVVRRLHDLEFAMFTWALGQRAKAHLGPSTLDERRP